jgi:molybdate transport system substrate-binding protein
MDILKTLLFASLFVARAATVAAQTLTIAAAADLQSALPPMVAQFEKETGGKVAVVFGSSGNFYAQIQNGAPFDVFLSADIDYPRRLERDGLAERGSLYEYATGQIVLWTRSDSGVDVRSGLAVVVRPEVRRIAIANPEHAPYGRAAVAALRHEGLYDRVRSKFVLGENIAQAAQFAQSGSAEVGVIALSLALAPALTGIGRYVEIPQALYPPIEQGAIILAASRQKGMARQFIDALKGGSAARILQQYGFGKPMPASLPDTR